MNRKQFMEQLERLLSDISEAERQEALEYYEGYFDDAGPENEGEVIRELGNPGKVAAIIKADLQENSEDYGEYTENGYQDTRVKENGEMPDHYTEVTVYGNGQGGSIVIREAKKILKTAGKDVPSAAITQRKSRIRQGSFLRLSFLFLRLL